jgi:hypothetical protein
MKGGATRRDRKHNQQHGISAPALAPSAPYAQQAYPMGSMPPGCGPWPMLPPPPYYQQSYYSSWSMPPPYDQPLYYQQPPQYLPSQSSLHGLGQQLGSMTISTPAPTTSPVAPAPATREEDDGAEMDCAADDDGGKLPFASCSSEASAPLLADVGTLIRTDHPCLGEKENVRTDCPCLEKKIHH